MNVIGLCLKITHNYAEGNFHKWCNATESEQETSKEEESDEESNYSNIELSLSDTDEFGRMS